jgi:hypothetical protein
MRLLRSAALIGGVLVLAAPALAQAEPTRITGGKGNFELLAAPGTTNDLTVTGEPDGSGGYDFVFTDSAGLTTNLFASCPGSTPGQTVQTIRCTGPFPPDDPPEDHSIRIDVGDSDDRVAVDLGSALDEVSQRVSGGEGNDNLFSDELSRNVFFGSLEGGPGNDRLKSGGAHSLKGEAGIDKLFAKNGVRNKANCGPGKNSKERAVIDKKKDKAISC